MGEVVQLHKPAAVPVLGTTVKVTVVMLVLTQVASLAYFVLFGVFSLQALTAVLESTHTEAVTIVEALLLQMSVQPLTYALVTAIAPLVGWWVYSRVDTGGQAKVMWAVAVLHTLVSVGLAIFLNGAVIMNVSLVVLNLVILVLYTVFFMGLGFIPAQLFKAKL